MPPLTEELLGEITFSMEDQSGLYYIDTVEQRVILDEEKSEENFERYIAIPDWTPSDGYNTMEKFVGTLKNETQREQLRAALDGGKGVFRRFKDVLKEYPILENQWYDFKERELKKAVIRWYHIEDEALIYSLLGEDELEVEPTYLFKEDFEFTSNVQSYQQEIEEIEQIKDDKREYLITTTNDQLVGFISYIIEERKATITYYWIKEEFRGFGLFSYLFSELSTTLQQRQIGEIFIKLTEKALAIEPMFDQYSKRTVTKTLAVDITQEGEEK